MADQNPAIIGIIGQLGTDRDTIKNKLVEMGVEVAESGKLNDVATAASGITVDTETTSIDLGMVTQSVELNPGHYYKNKVTVKTNILNNYVNTPVVPTDSEQTLGADGNTVMSTFKVAAVPVDTDNSIGTDEIVEVTEITSLDDTGFNNKVEGSTSLNVDAADDKWFKTVSVGKVHVAIADLSENESVYNSMYNGSAEPFEIGITDPASTSDINKAYRGVKIPRPKITDHYTEDVDLLTLGDVDKRIEIPAGFYGQTSVIIIENKELYDELAKV